MKKIRILFLGGAKRVSMAEKFISAGHRVGIEVEIFSYELSREVPIASIAGILTGLRWGAAPHSLIPARFAPLGY